VRVKYSEIVPPYSLARLVKLAWTLDCEGQADEWIEHVATPDGCIEVIRRLTGRSCWGETQPPTFVAGLVTRPTRFRMSGDASFVALRLWPWAWNAVATIKSPDLIDRWLPLPLAAAGLDLPTNADEALASFRPALNDELLAFGGAIIAASGAGDLAKISGSPPRRLQRWFKQHVGLPPREYLRLLRFQDALADMQHQPSSLADHAAAHGYADQAHMTREFKQLSGFPAGGARRRANGPFL
jgi:AraC-like DNA-binding protein